jgi:hypothetical protein
MSAPPTEERQVVWEVLAQIWVDTWYDPAQLDEFADRLARCGFSLRELDRIAHREVCGAFAIFTLTVFASAGMALPDWCFPKDQARKVVAAWLSRAAGEPAGVNAPASPSRDHFTRALATGLGPLPVHTR